MGAQLAALWDPVRGCHPAGGPGGEARWQSLGKEDRRQIDTLRRVSATIPDSLGADPEPSPAVLMSVVKS